MNASLDSTIRYFLIGLNRNTHRATSAQVVVVVVSNIRFDEGVERHLSHIFMFDQPRI